MGKKYEIFRYGKLLCSDLTAKEAAEIIGIEVKDIPSRVRVANNVDTEMVLRELRVQQTKHTAAGWTQELIDRWDSIHAEAQRIKQGRENRRKLTIY